MFLITVIVPVYNAENYLEKCIKSLLNQTLKDIQVIAIDDGSTDSSLKILREYEKDDNRLHVITQKNSGVAVARNKGIKLADGEFLAFVDSDDTIELETLERIYSRVKETDSDIGLFGYARIKENGTHVRDFLPSENSYDRQEGIKALLLNKFSSIACDKIFKASLIHGHNIEFPEDTFYEDAYFVFQAMTHANQSISIAKPYYRWLIRGESRSNSVSGKHIKNMFDILRQSKRYLEENDIYTDLLYEFQVRYLWHSSNIVGNKVLLINDIKLRTLLAVIFMKEVERDNVLSDTVVENIKASGDVPQKIISIYNEIEESSSLESLYGVFESQNTQSVGTTLHKLKRKYRNIKKRIKDKL